MKESIQILLQDVIDYAGLFPPAGLEMQPAVENYARYLQSSEWWMLGRFVVPITRLSEFEETASKFLPRGNPVYPWRLSVLASDNLRADLSTIVKFNQHHAMDENAGAVVVDTIELKAETIEEIERATWVLPRTITSYVEIPINNNTQKLIEFINRKKLRAKVRTGGLNEQAFPSAAQLAYFINLCAMQPLAFKATAGLHHPLRSHNRLTYEADSTSARMHGFLNVFLASAFARFGMPEKEVAALLEESSIEVFSFDEEGIKWRDHHLTLQRISVARLQVAISFGSCSFEEPVEDLKRIGLL